MRPVVICILIVGAVGVYLWKDYLTAAENPGPQRVVEDPFRACDYLIAAGLPTNGWKVYGADDFGCTSPYRELGAGSPANLANNLSYYVSGTVVAASSAKLLLNVNHRASESAARAELLQAARMLSLAAFSKDLPPRLETAIRAGRKASATLATAKGEARIAVQRIDWPTGKGYELQVTLSPL
jgi:hypothetical protein